MKKQSGFSLVELLVVIAIIGLLAGLAIFTLQGARAKARDGVRSNDISNLKNALNLYYGDHNDKYPNCLNSPSGVCPAGWTCSDYDICFSDTGGNWLTGLESYMNGMPDDPSNYNYLFISFIPETGHFCQGQTSEQCFADFKTAIVNTNLPFFEYLLCFYLETNMQMNSVYKISENPDFYCTGML